MRVNQALLLLSSLLSEEGSMLYAIRRGGLRLPLGANNMARTTKLFSVACLFLSSVMMFAQQNNAELAGTVTDPSGAVLTNTKVVIQQPSTGASRETHTNNSGFYAFTQLPPGVYTVTVSHAGFADARRETIELTVGQQARLDVRMQIEAVSSEAIVNAGTAQVETESAALSSVMDKDSIRELPLNGRDIVQLAT